MGFFFSKQDKLDDAAKQVFDDISLLTHTLDLFEGELSEVVLQFAVKAENSIVTFCNVCQKYQTTHNYVRWNGSSTLITGVLGTITGFVTEIEQRTGYIFTKLR
jgi:hypothetical protein